MGGREARYRVTITIAKRNQMPRLKITELDAPPDTLTPDLRSQLEAAGFDLGRDVYWLRDKRGVVYFQDDEGAQSGYNQALSGAGG